MSGKKCGSGDNGITSLLGGVKILKDDPVMECLGNIDELNSLIGCSSILLKNDTILEVKEDEKEEGKEYSLYSMLEKIQCILITLGSHIAGPDKYDFPRGAYELVEDYIKTVDYMTPKLTKFILPRGEYHHIRTVARRSERSYLTISKEDIRYSDNGFKFLNRLSDLFFAIARYHCSFINVEEIEFYKVL